MQLSRRLVVTISREDEYHFYIYSKGVGTAAASDVASQLEQARILLNKGAVDQAQPNLLQCAGAGSAEAAYYLGVMATQSGDLKRLSTG